MSDLISLLPCYAEAAAAVAEVCGSEGFHTCLSRGGGEGAGTLHAIRFVFDWID
jgi:hypothetical protein